MNLFMPKVFTVSLRLFVRRCTVGRQACRYGVNNASFYTYRGRTSLCSSKMVWDSGQPGTGMMGCVSASSSSQNRPSSSSATAARPPPSRPGPASTPPVTPSPPAGAHGHGYGAADTVMGLQTRLWGCRHGNGAADTVMGLQTRLWGCRHGNGAADSVMGLH